MLGGYEMEILPNDSVAEADSLSKSPQLDVLLAEYAVQRADCSAIYGSSTGTHCRRNGVGFRSCW